MRNYNIDELLSMEPLGLLNLLKEEFDRDVPEIIETTEDLRLAGRALGILAADYSYLTQLAVYAKLDVREKKRSDPKNKEAVEDAIDRKSVIEAFLNGADMRYKAVSRMLTTKQQINEELRMTDSIREGRGI